LTDIELFVIIVKIGLYPIHCGRVPYRILTGVTMIRTWDELLASDIVLMEVDITNTFIDSNFAVACIARDSQTGQLYLHRSTKFICPVYVDGGKKWVVEMTGEIEPPRPELEFDKPAPYFSSPVPTRRLAASLGLAVGYQERARELCVRFNDVVYIAYILGEIPLTEAEKEVLGITT
jgi:hypothetical protein